MSAVRHVEAIEVLEAVYGPVDAEIASEERWEALRAHSAPHTHEGCPVEELHVAWIGWTLHEKCATCSALIDYAITHARVMGSCGSTYSEESSSGEHAARVQAQTLQERRTVLV